MSTLTIPIQHCTGGSSQSITRGNKRHLEGKEEAKPSLLEEGMTLDIENPKESTNKLLELKNNFREFVGYKINIQKLTVFLHISNDQSKNEIKNVIPFIIASK